MKRKTIPAREHYADKIEELGFFYHPDYWGEGRYYEFTQEETDRLETATRELYSMACDAAEHIISNNLYAEMRIPEAVRAYINHSWLDDELSVYGRFDLYFDGRDIKLYEFNADTPTSLLESSIIQWNWKEECFPEQDQFNSIHEALVQSWKDIDEQNGIDRLFVACSRENEEDLWNLRYMAYTAMEAGLDVAEVDMDQLYYNNGLLLAQSGEVVRDCFKLYPWEWMFNESPEACGARLHWYEPMWKALMSNKMILYTMYLLFPDSPYLLPTWNFLPTSVTRTAVVPASIGRDRRRLWRGRIHIPGIEATPLFRGASPCHRQLDNWWRTGRHRHPRNQRTDNGKYVHVRSAHHCLISVNCSVSYFFCTFAPFFNRIYYGLIED